MVIRALSFAGLIAGSSILPAGAVIFLDTDDVTHNTGTPGDNSGWQYEGKFNDFLGVPIAPYFFITAQHIGGGVGNVLNFHGDNYTTIAVHDIPLTDLRVWEVDHSKPFPTYAPLSSGTGNVGATATLIGRGTQRGIQVMVSGERKGWQWGTGDGVERWGRNVVKGSVNAASLGELLYCDFDNPGVADECHLSVGDSGGGMFVLEDGLWRLAGINYGVDGPFRYDSSSPAFNAAIFDAGGLEYQDTSGWIPLADEAANLPASFYCSRISASLTAIAAIAPEVGSLANENFAAWQKLYFTPAEIALPLETGPLADYDGDGISNVLEFAFNLDPSFNGQTAMTAGTGFGGLPLVRLETISGADHVTIEYMRRSGGSGSGLTYVPQFSSDLENWETTGTESVVAINPRWERVKRVDSSTTDDTSRRFARVNVVLAE